MGNTCKPMAVSFHDKIHYNKKNKNNLKKRTEQEARIYRSFATKGS